MSDPTDDEDELNGNPSEAADEKDSGEDKKGKSGAGSAGGAKFSVPETDEEIAAKRKKKGDSGEGDADSFGRGKAGAGAGIKLSAQKNKEVWAAFRELSGQELVEAVVEFFSELPMRASANIAVAWEKTKTNIKSFAIVNWALEAGDKAVRELAKNRDRVRGAGRDSRGLQRQKPRVGGINPAMGPTGPTGTN